MKSKNYIEYNTNKARLFFSTAEEGMNFNRHTDDGRATLNKIKDDFNVEEVLYLRQIHSTSISTYKGEPKESFIEAEGDGIITNIKNVAIGIFTADCVPIILVDDNLGVTAALHSGWKGTIGSIVKIAIEKMSEEYGCNINDIKVYIGAHIRQCCYEISDELKNRFLKETNIKEEILFRGRNLSMEECILEDLRKLNIKMENIHSLELCTYCNEGVKLHSYRKSEGDYGRMFSFVILN